MTRTPHLAAAERGQIVFVSKSEQGASLEDLRPKVRMDKTCGERGGGWPRSENVLKKGGGETKRNGNKEEGKKRRRRGEEEEGQK